uniref:Uncharacterized protein n=1 Tax=Anguilla anguilla TaxID=7936 RepID=A0A0E9WP12_ANGAN
MIPRFYSYSTVFLWSVKGCHLECDQKVLSLNIFVMVI